MLVAYLLAAPPTPPSPSQAPPRTLRLRLTHIPADQMQSTFPRRSCPSPSAFPVTALHITSDPSSTYERLGHRGDAPVHPHSAGTHPKPPAPPPRASASPATVLALTHASSRLLIPGEPLPVPAVHHPHRPEDPVRHRFDLRGRARWAVRPALHSDHRGVELVQPLDELLQHHRRQPVQHQHPAVVRRLGRHQRQAGPCRRHRQSFIVATGRRLDLVSV